MEGSEIYTLSNGLQKKGMDIVLKEYFHVLRWQDGDRILDVGCGPGDLTSGIIAERIPCKWSEIVGMDFNSSMVEYAWANCVHREGISFIQGDIGAPEPPLNEKFNKILSFYCLHWLLDHRPVARNLLQMLHPGGEALLAFLAYCPIYVAYEAFAKSKWAPYMQDYKEFISPFYYSRNPCQDIIRIYQESGFEVRTVHLKNIQYTFQTMDIFKKSCAAINPFLNRIPKELHEAYLNDFMDIIIKSKLIDEKEDNDHKQKDSYQNVKIHYSLLIVHLGKA